MTRRCHPRAGPLESDSVPSGIAAQGGGHLSTVRYTPRRRRGNRRPCDVRRAQLVRLNRSSAKSIWKELQSANKVSVAVVKGTERHDPTDRGKTGRSCAHDDRACLRSTAPRARAAARSSADRSRCMVTGCPFAIEKIRQAEEAGPVAAALDGRAGCRRSLRGRSGRDCARLPAICVPPRPGPSGQLLLPRRHGRNRNARLADHPPGCFWPKASRTSCWRAAHTTRWPRRWTFWRRRTCPW